MKSFELNGVNYRVVKKKSVLGQLLLDKYENYEGVDLCDVYGHHSERKESSLRWCRNRMLELHGYGLVITGHNISQFSCAFVFTLYDKKYLAYFIRNNNYIVCLED